MDYFNLFFLSFLSSTLLPGGSEVYLIWLLQDTQLNPLILLVTATTGNSLGGFSNWIIGYLIINNIFTALKLQKKQKNKQYHIAEAWIKQWGYTILLLSWMPIIGDLICLVAGVYKLNAYRCIIYIFTGKFFRYLALIFITQNISL
jgi:membrane protein YqaA with SNARE-associated domain